MPELQDFTPNLESKGLRRKSPTRPGMLWLPNTPRDRDRPLAYTGKVSMGNHQPLPRLFSEHRQPWRRTPAAWHFGQMTARAAEPRGLEGQPGAGIGHAISLASRF